MPELDGIRTGRHRVPATHVHLVLVTTFRHPVFADRHLTRMEQITRVTCAATPRPNWSLKGVSSRRPQQESPDLVRHYHRANKLWSDSYFAGSVGRRHRAS
ncbi:transposase [Micromonospora sp. LOL_015]|uniref:transposase n=1 Tax=Micromonospora sp. LOL_015 TaxID=3345416 RepID=UPI003A897AAC